MRTYTGTRSQNLFTFIVGTRRPDGTCCQSIPGFSNILVSDPDGRKAWFDGLYLQIDRPYSGSGKFKDGYGVTYTLGDAEQRRRSLQPPGRTGAWTCKWRKGSTSPARTWCR
ncbi:MAG TPA: hypothetical protein VFT24_09280 [Vicinamibacterales bacterium]|nr:hypothetical protein [Vicinamibacterales bacterium]